MIRGMLPAQSVVACLKFDAFCKMHRRRVCSLLRAKREPEKHPLLSKRGRHEKGAARPFQTPKEKSKWKNASRFAKRIFLTSPICCSAAGVTSLLTVKFC